jgi:AAA+ superfamily predicted ATPase
MKFLPHIFYKLVPVYRQVSPFTQECLAELAQSLTQERLQAEDSFSEMKQLQDQFRSETAYSLREKTVSEWSPLGEHPDKFSDNATTNLLTVATEVAKSVRNGYSFLQGLLFDIQPTQLMLSESCPDFTTPPKLELLQQLTYEMQTNQEVLERFVDGIQVLREGRKHLLTEVDHIIHVLEQYHAGLVQRHFRDGVPVCCGSVLGTDLALSIYSNVDRHGEIESGTSPDKVSAYSLHKANVFIRATQIGLLSTLKQSGQLLAYIEAKFTDLWKTLARVEYYLEPTMQKVYAIIAPHFCYQMVTDAMLAEKWNVIRNVDPQNVVHRDPGRLMSAAELLEYQQWATSLEYITQKVLEDDTENLTQYVLQRKAELHSWQRDENSFYVCRIGSGNQFRGIAPGALEVVPGIRPNVNLDEILGSGFDEVRAFTRQVESAAKWHNLFVATSPSRTADKSNVLLIGPMGCGKTQVLRAVGCDTKSVGIFASGSDFNTCWLGEATKNPKRLFQEGLRIQKESGKHVHFLIDEIDSILNNDRQNAGYINLTLEFQILMDGVVHYPNLSVWGTTNNPQRIPMPMIRRFSKVLVVGELDQKDRVRLLQHFMSFLPTNSIPEATWQEAATKLEGATGDVIRKVVDAIWRETMTSFVQNQPQKAEELSQWLNAKHKFSITDFNAERQEEFQKLLRQSISVSPETFMQHVDILLENVAILHEIETAKLIYENARMFLSSVVEDRG